MTVLLAGDIGGTKTILRLADAQCGETASDTVVTPLYEEQYASGEFPGHQCPVTDVSPRSELRGSQHCGVS